METMMEVVDEDCPGPASVDVEMVRVVVVVPPVGIRFKLLLTAFDHPSLTAALPEKYWAAEASPLNTH
jgi:hypothetical protein